MLALSRSGTEEFPTDESRDEARSSKTFNRDVAAKIGKYIEARRILCALSQQQLGVRLGLRATEVSAYEQGAKRMSCKLLLETAKQLKVRPRFFFQ
jgi:hypothetical protein